MGKSKKKRSRNASTSNGDAQKPVEQNTQLEPAIVEEAVIAVADNAEDELEDEAPTPIASTSRASTPIQQGNVHLAVENASAETTGISASSLDQRNGDNASQNGNDEEEEEDEEPSLRYKRIQSQSTDAFFAKDSCSCLTASDKYLVLGSHNGVVAIFKRSEAQTGTGSSADLNKGKGKATQDTAVLDIEGSVLVKKYRAHSAGITDIVIDEESQYIGTASIDGKVIIYQLATNDAQAFDQGRPLRCLAFEPGYTSKSTRQFVSGGMAGNLVLHEKGWLGPKDVTLHSGEGPIWSVKWRRNYIAWANDKGVRIYDTHAAARIAFIPRAEDSPRADLYPCSLLWQSDTRLVVGWADFIRIIDIRDRKYQQDIIRKQQEEKEAIKSSGESIQSDKSAKSTKTVGIGNPLKGMGSYMPSVVTASSTPIQTYAEVSNVLQLDCMISGIVPFSSMLKDSSKKAVNSSAQSALETTTSYIILSYVTEEEEDANGEDVYQKPATPAQPPELRIIEVTSGEETSSDVLAISKYERYQCRDYRIAATTAAAAAGGVCYFVVSPTDLVQVNKRDEWDHVAWLCERRMYEEAMQFVEKRGLKEISMLDDRHRSSGKSYNVREIGRDYLNFLYDDGQVEKAARNMGKILGQDAKALEAWVSRFVQDGHIEVVIPYVTTSSPRLEHSVYELVLDHFLHGKPEVLLQTLKTWPQEIYDYQVVISAIKTSLDDEDRSSPAASVLMECLIEIYMANRQPGKALPYYLRLKKPGVFELIKQYNLFADINDQALLLVDFQQDLKRRRDKELPPQNDRYSRQIAGLVSKHGEAIDLLVEHVQAIPAGRAVGQLRSNPFYLYMYLDALCAKDPQAVFPFSDNLIELYAEHDYPRLLDFLRASTNYDLEAAYDICKAKDFVPEMVYLLGRMGSNKQALTLIIERLGEVQRAIDFAKEQNDADLWEDLLRYSESRPTFIRGLLENVGPEVDPIRLIRRIKNGLKIPGLKPAIIKILQDFNIQISLIEGCKAILATDCRRLTLELYDGQTNAFFGSTQSSMCFKCAKPAFLPPLPSSSTPASATTQEATAIIFLCHHVLHINCALPDADLPSRPQHFLNPLIADDLNIFGEVDHPLDMKQQRDRDFATRMLFVSQLKSRVPVPISCPACIVGKGGKVVKQVA